MHTLVHTRIWKLIIRCNQEYTLNVIDCGYLVMHKQVIPNFSTHLPLLNHYHSSLGHTKLITCFLDSAGPFLSNSAKKCKLVGVVILWEVHQCVLCTICGCSWSKMNPICLLCHGEGKISHCSSHSTGLKDDFVIPSPSETATTEYYYKFALMYWMWLIKFKWDSFIFSPPPGSLFLRGLSEKQIIDLVCP